tara:strand:- start:654 stop:935 length:282 start_codon:yes stop_codon:yes gene_type:complete
MALNLVKAPANFKETKPMYKPYKSSKSGKDGMVYVMKNGSKSLLHFGDSSMANNTSPEAKKSYMARSAGITDKSGKKTASDKNSANYWSRRNW